MLRVEFGVHTETHAMYDFEVVSQMATLTEELGYDYFLIGDHFFSSEKRYESLDWDPRKPTKLDAWATSLMLALKTRKIKIGPCVSPVTFYLPSRLARMAASVDILSGGRLVLGLGAGRNEDEARAYGIKWDRFNVRAEKLEEAVQIIKKMHTEDRSSFSGKHYSLNNAPLFPKPIQKPHPPIWIGGLAEPLLKIAAKHCDGWVIGSYGKWAETPLIEHLRSRLERIRNFAREYKRDLSDFMVACMLFSSPSLKKTAGEWINEIDRFISSGANCILVKHFLKPEETSERINSFAKEVIPSFR